MEMQGIVSEQGHNGNRTLIMILKRWVNYQKIRFFFCRKCQPYGYS
ncbi:Cell division protein FtsK [Cronobacter malonaticus 507]|nr:Cell division protein FtsK [Cronobacter malonaticus 507]